MKINILSRLFAAVAIIAPLAGCEDEKDLIIIEGNLPIKTTTLYMVGDATPNGWSIDSPTALTATEADALVFEWEGELSTGEMKLCLTTGSWDVSFIRPSVDGDKISKTDLTDYTFAMHAGDPDDKWDVTDAGKYRLSFNLREWTMSTTYLGESDPEVIEPISADALYLVGDAAPTGWNIDAPTAMQKSGDYIFTYEGALNAGELKACASTGSWDVKFIRPSSNGVEIGKSGVAADNFVYTTSPDDKWLVTAAGEYKLTLDLENYKISVEFVKEIEEGDKDPIETSTLYMVGDATPGGWSMDAATAFTQSASDSYVFTWEGELVTGSFKACLEPDGTFSCPFIRPESDGVTVSAEGVSASGFVYTTSPDYQWQVTEAGTYRITFNLRDWTIAVTTPGGEEETEPLESSTLYMIGDATPGGWSMDNPTELTRSESDSYVFTWEGELSTGEMKACLAPDGTFSCPFLRPATDGVEISASGVAESGFVYTTSPDNKWRVTAAGRYRITFDLKNWTIQATYLN